MPVHGAPAVHYDIDPAVGVSDRVPVEESLVSLFGKVKIAVLNEKSSTVVEGKTRAERETVERVGVLVEVAWGAIGSRNRIWRRKRCDVPAERGNDGKGGQHSEDSHWYFA